MPNDCWNNITITASESDLDALMRTEFIDVPEGAIDILQRGQYGVMIRLWSAWTPNFIWMETLLPTYPSCWVKNEWREEGGTAGVWVGRLVEGRRVIQSMEWKDLSVEEEMHVFRPAAGVLEATTVRPAAGVLEATTVRSAAEDAPSA